MKAKLLLFDIDGTLLLSGGAGAKAMLEAGQQLFGNSFNFDLDTSGKLDTQIYKELSKLNAHLDMQHRHDEFRDAYLKKLEFELHWDNKAFVMPGIMELLERLRKLEHVTLGLLTGNYGPAARAKLKAVDIQHDWFPITAFGDEGVTRPDLIELAMKRYKDSRNETLQPREVVVIGDTPKDVACAQAHGCIAFAVATGKWSVEELQAARADIVVDNLSDASRLLELL
jgi:phosphoglycolate phosphatase-like HAD superfamily hydrolase